MRFSERELEILALVKAGHKPKEIAGMLGIAYATIKAHFNRMYMKAGIVDGCKIVKLVTMV